MKYFLIILLISPLFSCTSLVDKSKIQSKIPSEQTAKQSSNGCLGNVELPSGLSDYFDAIEDMALLDSTLGEPNKGMLCQGKVYKAKKNVDLTVFRAWNSTNPDSRSGKWWAFSRPDGRVAKYRSDYEVCYQWSPLDKLTDCKLKANAKIVVGTGQSATCSEYLSYPVSSVKQIYIEDASSLYNCRDHDALFSWASDSE